MINKNLLLLLPSGFEIYEASAFIDVFGWNNTYGSEKIDLHICGAKKHVISTFNVELKTDVLLADVNINDYQALAIPGGFEEYNYYQEAFSDEFQQLIAGFFEQNKPISTVCVGALPLAKSGLLNKSQATTYNITDNVRIKQLEGFGAQIVNLPIVKHQNITTSTGPSTAINVALDLLAQLTNQKNSNYIRKIMGF